MPFKITIGHQTTSHNSDRSDRSSSSDTDGDSSGTGVHLSPSSETHEYPDPVEEQDESWNVLFPDEIGPSDSASRPQTSNQQRPIVEAPRPEEAHRPSYQRQLTDKRVRNVQPPRAHRSPPSTEPESVDSHEDWQGYARGPPPGRPYTYYAPNYPPAQYQTYPPQSLVHAGQQQVIPYGFSAYHVAPGGAGPNFFSPGHHGHAIASPGGTTYGPPPGFYPYAPQSFPMPQAMPPPAMYQPYAPMYSPPPLPTPPPSSDTSKDDEKFARLEKLLLDQKEEQAAKEAAARKAAADKAAQAEADAIKAQEIKAASEQAAAAAKEEVTKEHKAAADKAAADAAAATAAAPPKEKDKPIKFKDAVGRKFSFPFHLCSTWSGMEYLIKEAFAHVEVIGPHVAEGHYDLLGPQGEIILPHVWETVIEPDWTITMHMWPMNEEKEGDALADGLADIMIVEGVPPPPPPAPSAPGGVAGDEKKEKAKKQKPSPFLAWTAGKKNKTVKVKKK